MKNPKLFATCQNFRVTHTCCDLKWNNVEEMSAHTDNDCFLYELPDGSNGTYGEVLENEDIEGYKLLKSANKIPEQFANYSGYRLRLFLLRNKALSQLIVKGIERSEYVFKLYVLGTCLLRCLNSKKKKKSLVRLLDVYL